MNVRRTVPPRSLLKLAEAPGHRARGRGGEVFERAFVVPHQSKARGQRVPDVKARVGVQHVKLARERLLRDALDDGAKFVRDLFQPLDEDDLGLTARARTA